MDSQRLLAQIAAEASAESAAFWLGRMRYLEERLSDPADRWIELRRSLEDISRGRRMVKITEVR